MYCRVFLVRADEPSKKELTPAEKKAEKAKRAAAEKERKKKVNAPARIRKIEVCCMRMTFERYRSSLYCRDGRASGIKKRRVFFYPIKALSPSWRLYGQGFHDWAHDFYQSSAEFVAWWFTFIYLWSSSTCSMLFFCPISSSFLQMLHVS